MKGLIDKVKKILEALPWCTVDSVDGSWRRTVASDILKLNLVCQRQLAQTLCGQLRERLKASHESFIVALRHLEAHHNERLERTGEQGFRLRKIHAPRLARLALETSSIIDFLRFGETSEYLVGDCVPVLYKMFDFMCTFLVLRYAFIWKRSWERPIWGCVCM